MRLVHCGHQDINTIKTTKSKSQNPVLSNTRIIIKKNPDNLAATRMI